MKKGLLFIFMVLILLGCTIITKTEKVQVVDSSNVELNRNGQTILKSTSLPFTGTIGDYYETGEIKKKVNYTNGKKNGEQIWYYETGQIKYKYNYTNGNLNGEFIGYYETGQIKYKVNYTSGKRNGEGIGYYKNGQIESKENFKDGKKNGESIGYSKTGEV